MRFVFLITFLFLLSPLQAEEAIKTWIKPIDYEQEQVWETLTQRIFQIETDGEHIYVRTENPHLIKIDRNGRFLGPIGGDPTGRTYEKQPTFGFSVWNNKIVTFNQDRQFSIYKDGALLKQFTSDSFLAMSTRPQHNSNAFAFNGEKFVLTAPPHAGAAAAVIHNIQGERLRTLGIKQRFATPLAWEEGVNAAFWVWDGSFWYSLNKFKPLLIKYHPDFKEAARFELGGEQIGDSETYIYDMAGDPQRILPPIFSDFKVFRGDIYTMSRDALFHFDGKNGALKRKFKFFGRGEDFKEVENLPLTLPLFLFLNDGQLILAHPGQPWNHNLWTVELPPVDKNRS